MKHPQEQSLRWLKQAEYDLKESEKSLAGGSFAYAAFFAEQSSQKSLKAFLIFKGRRFVNIHSIGELLKEASLLEESFRTLIDFGQKLDRYYLASRYPDALPSPAIPAESYSKSEAQEAAKIAREIFETCQSLIERSQR